MILAVVIAVISWPVSMMLQFFHPGPQIYHLYYKPKPGGCTCLFLFFHKYTKIAKNVFILIGCTLFYYSVTVLLEHLFSHF